MNHQPIHELRFSTPGAWSAAFERLLGDSATRLCVAQPRDLTLRVRTTDPRTLRLDGRIVEPSLLAVS
jgi:hypothetical protein